jgi:hypothetical protein
MTDNELAQIVEEVADGSLSAGFAARVAELSAEDQRKLAGMLSQERANSAERAELAFEEARKIGRVLDDNGGE